VGSGRARCLRQRVSVFDETAEEVDFAGGDSIDVILRRPHGPSDGFGEDVEGTLLPRNATPKSALDFFRLY